MPARIRITFVQRDGPDSPELLFVDVHDQEGKSIEIGRWHTTEDGYKELEISENDMKEL